MTTDFIEKDYGRKFHWIFPMLVVAAVIYLIVTIATRDDGVRTMQSGPSVERCEDQVDDDSEPCVWGDGTTR